MLALANMIGNSLHLSGTLSPRQGAPSSCELRGPPDLEDSCEFVEIILSREMVLVPNMSTSVQITLTAEAQLAEGPIFIRRTKQQKSL
jgi:hypothetical protein